MERIERHVTTRGYELDRTGRIPPATLLRYLEHLRWEAITEAATGIRAMFEGGHKMVVVGQRLAVQRELGRGAPLACTMWIGRAGRSSLDFHHAIRRVDDGQRVARAIVTVVHLDGNNRSTALPEEVRAAVQPDDEPLEVPRLAEAPPLEAWSGPLAVRPSDLDVLQHVNHASWVSYVEDARSAAATAEAYGAQSREVGRAPARALAIDYLQQAVLGDQLTVLSWISSTRPGPAYGFELRRQSDGVVLCRAWVAT